jgi:putative radical SAM enzyme (TIGR03279 family)
MSAVISKIYPKSLAERVGIKGGDKIEYINGKEIIDYLDYMYLSANEEIEISLSDGRNIFISNPDYEPLGIEFETLLIDKPKSCLNKCVFCFIDQLPPNMRESCYFKDDDYRLSFLQGNYVTLTNMSDRDLDRILEYSLPRINISVHTTNPELRKKMLNNKNAGKIMEQIKKLAEGGLNMNCQIVLCPGYNDGAELEKTIEDLGKFCFEIESVSIVPVGITDFRENLPQMTSFTKESAENLIKQIEKWQKYFYDKIGTNFVDLSDEFYITADIPIPDSESYYGFPQIENGVGLCASLRDEFNNALSRCENRVVKTEKSIATGVIAYDFIKECASLAWAQRLKI